jgi:hypothetical protein
MNKRIRVAGTNDDTRNSGFNKGMSTRRLLSEMAARLQSYINCRSLWIFAPLLAIFERIPLGMKLAVSMMPALADDFSVFDNHGSDKGIRIRLSLASFCQINRTTHEFFFVTFHKPILIQRL